MHSLAASLVGLLTILTVAVLTIPVSRWLVGWWDEYLTGKLGIDSMDEPIDGLPHEVAAGLPGTVERVFFIVAIGLGLPGTVIGMVGWTALKAQIQYQVFAPLPQVDASKGTDIAHRVRCYVASMGSMFCAMVFGALAAGVAPAVVEAIVG